MCEHSETRILGPGFLSSLPPGARLSQGQHVFLTHNGREVEGRVVQHSRDQVSEARIRINYGILCKSFIFPILHCIASICHLLSQNCTTLLGLFEVRSQYNVLCSYCIITVSFPVRCPVSREWPVPGRGPALTTRLTCLPPVASPTPAPPPPRNLSILPPPPLPHSLAVTRRARNIFQQ